MKKTLKSIGTMLVAGTMLFATGCQLFVPTEDDTIYTITFKQDGYADMTFEVQSGSSLTTVPTPKDVTGYTVGWDRTDFSNVTSDLTVTAIAVPNEYEITYLYYEGGSDILKGEYTQTVTYNAEYTLRTESCYGYTFMGWAAESEILPQTGIWTYAQDMTLTSKWSDNSYTITFMQEDGSSETRRVECGDVLKAEDVPSIAPVEGYDVAWSVTDFSTIKENTTVNVVKTAKSYVVTYSLADGESVVDGATDIVTYGSAYQLKTPTKAGFTFRYWKQENGTPVPVSGEKWLYPTNMTLTAEWTQKDNLITFIHADNTTEERTVKTGEALPEAEIPAPKQIDGYDVEWDVKDFSSITGSITVYAVKKAKSYTVTYSLAEGETLAETQQTVTFDSEYTLKTPTKYGYTFVGWKTAEDKLVAISGKWNIASDVTLSAKWQDNFYTVTFIHADNTTTEVKVEKQGALTSIPACKQITGYDCVWESADFSVITSDMRVKAVKTPKEYTVTYQLSSGETVEGGNTLQVKYGEAYTLATPKNTNPDLEFAGWKDSATQKEVYNSGNWEIAGDVTLVAVWKSSGDWTQNY